MRAQSGSDTVTVFGVEGSRLVRRQILPSRGDLPVSVSVAGDLVYVLNARDGGSISGYRIVGGRWPIVRVRGSHGSWMAEDDESARAGSGRTPEEAVGDWFLRNADRMGFEIRRYG